MLAKTHHHGRSARESARKKSAQPENLPTKGESENLLGKPVNSAADQSTFLKMLDVARRGDDQHISVLVVILCMANGKHRIVYWEAEYGDMQGSRSVAEVAANLRPLLRTGEQICLAGWSDIAQKYMKDRLFGVFPCPGGGV